MKTSCFKYYTGNKGVAICVYPPNNWTGPRFLPLEPSRDMFFNVKQGRITREEYIKQYNEQLEKLDAKEVYEVLKNNVLLCWENSGAFCHRILVAQWIKDKLGIEVPEWNVADEKLEQSNNIKPLF